MASPVLQKHMPFQRFARLPTWRKPSFVFLAKSVHPRAKLAAFSFVTCFDSRIWSWKSFIAHPAGRSGATLLRFSGGHSGSDRAAAGLPKPAPRVAPTALRREGPPQACSEPSACRNQGVLALHSSQPFLRWIQVPVTAPVYSRLPPEH